MKKSILQFSLLLGLYYGSSQAMDIRSMAPGAIIGTSVLAGCSIQFIKWIFEQERYKQVWPLVKIYPGLVIMGVGTVTGLTFMYGRPLVSMFSTSEIVKNS